MIKKQMAERKKSASEKSNRNAARQKGVEENDSAKRSAENSERLVVMEEKRPLPSAGKPRTPRIEVKNTSCN